MACVQHPGVHPHWTVDARRIGGGRWEAVPGLGCGRSLDQKSCFVGSTVESAFGGKRKDARKLWALGGGHKIQEVSRQWKS